MDTHTPLCILKRERNRENDMMYWWISRGRRKKM